jgi:hypothetical protein
MLLHVTEKHIKDGAPRDAFTCPIALGMKELGYHDACVGSTHYTVNGRNPRRTCMTKVMKEFIRKFDAGKKVKPATFRISI